MNIAACLNRGGRERWDKQVDGVRCCGVLLFHWRMDGWRCRIILVQVVTSFRVFFGFDSVQCAWLS